MQSGRTWTWGRCSSWYREASRGTRAWSEPNGRHAERQRGPSAKNLLAAWAPAAMVDVVRRGIELGAGEQAAGGVVVMVARGVRCGNRVSVVV